MSESNHHQKRDCTGLTPFIRNVTADPVAWGGSSDFYLGDLVTFDASSQSRKVGLKVFRTTCHAPKPSQLVSAEAVILGTLNYNNIVEFLGVAHIRGRPCIVTAWHPLGNASAYLAGRSTKERLHLLGGVTKGLCYLHSRTPAIAHGDIKGANIVVNNTGEGVLCDFGSSQILSDTDAGPSQSNIPMNGSFRWMAIELIKSEVVLGAHTSSDVWAFGCTFYELLLGKRPYASCEMNWAVFHDIVKGGLPFLEGTATRVGSRNMWMTIRQCWNPIPENRPTIFRLTQSLSVPYD